jgi:hypothetical protein
VIVSALHGQYLKPGSCEPGFFVLHAARGTWFHLLTGLAPPIIIAK